jgi:hypothetical protein
MFVIIDLETIIYIQYVCTSMICLNTKFQASGSNGSLIISIKPRSTRNILTATMLLFYCIEKYFLNNNYVPKNYDHILFHIRKIPCQVGLLSPQHGASSGCGWKKHPPGMEGSCEYIE